MTASEWEAEDRMKPIGWREAHWTEVLADLAACEKERDEWMNHSDRMADSALVAISRAEKAEARVKVLEEDLRPFAAPANLTGGDNDYLTIAMPMKRFREASVALCKEGA